MTEMCFSFSEVNGKGQDLPNVLASEQMAPRGQLVFSVGIGALIFVPVFKALTGLPPYMGMLLGLGVLWILTDAIHYGESERQRLKVPQALSRIDTQGVLFFLGILLSVSRYTCKQCMDFLVPCLYSVLTICPALIFLWILCCQGLDFWLMFLSLISDLYSSSFCKYSVPPFYIFSHEKSTVPLGGRRLWFSWL